ncbi:hypothetical protein PROAA_370005 [Candidatus Propionivibrio aalborgensis]|uniref:Uncharacterized protein n=1 Tax=Candidatus Propionivibrio aalborgensis TaxID=1860101 RepID=A0A1A8XZB3_9RHOO|nr:hypothetical protein PROAA_370005 [Candidatus Propionivibrio aalborgensis]
MVGQYAQRRAVHFLATRLTSGGRNQALEKVDVVVAVHVLQHGGDTLQPHAGVNRGFGQEMHDAVLVAIELHEDVIPDLDVTVAVFIGRSRRTAWNMLAVVVENLCAGAAGAGVAHHPEVVRSVARPLVVADANNALCRDADHRVPDFVSLIVLGIYRDPQSLLWQLVDIDQQFPGVLDGIELEVVAEREIAEHLEEGVMARGVANVFKIVMLAAGPNALLRSCCAIVGPLVEAQEYILELVHPGIGKQQGRILMRNERTGCHDLVAFGLKELEKFIAYFGAFHRKLSLNGQVSKGFDFSTDRVGADRGLLLVLGGVMGVPTSANAQRRLILAPHLTNTTPFG